MRKRYLSATLLCALGSLLLSIPEAKAQGPDAFNPMLPYYPEEYYSFHLASGLFFAEGLIELDDGSQWKIADSERAQMLSWRANDFVVITANHYFSDYTYYITNQVNGTYVHANLVNGPTIGGSRTMLISGLDANSRNKRAVYLNNGTSWAIDPSDLQMIENWQIGDPIIVGRNDSWFSYSSSLLINVLTNTFVRARKI